MKRFFHISIVLAVAFGVNPAIIKAEEVEIQVISYITKIEYMAVPDVENHSIGVYERRGVAVLKNREQAAYHSKGTWDYRNSTGPFQGYTILTFKDGSTMMDRHAGMTTKASGKLPTFEGKGEYIKGTGKYEGIKGAITFQGGFITPYNKETKGDIIINTKGNYTLP